MRRAQNWPFYTDLRRSNMQFQFISIVGWVALETQFSLLILLTFRIILSAFGVAIFFFRSADRSISANRQRSESEKKKKLFKEIASGYLKTSYKSFCERSQTDFVNGRLERRMRMRMCDGDAFVMKCSAAVAQFRIVLTAKNCSELFIVLFENNAPHNSRYDLVIVANFSI